MYIKESILITSYTILIILQISSTSYILDNSDRINDILQNESFKIKCKNDSINKILYNGSTYNNICAILASSTVIIGSFLLIMINKYIEYKIDIKNKNSYQSLTNDIDDFENKYEDENLGLISKKIIDKKMYVTSINTIFVISIFSYIITNGIQFILQINNVNNNCIEYINNYVDNFTIMYKIMLYASFLSSYTLFITIPCMCY